MKKKMKIVIDTAMLILLPLLMAYSLIGEQLHEIVGTAIFVLFIAHHVMNRGWYRALFKGRYTPGRILQTVLNTLLLAVMLAQPVSGILTSKYLYTFIRVSGVSATAREVHLCLAYWGLALMCIHAGTHLSAPMNKLKERRKTAYGICVAVLALISVYGAYAFIKRQLAEYMFLKNRFAFFDFSEPKIAFFTDYLSIMALFAFVGWLAICGLRALSNKKPGKKADLPRSSTPSWRSS